MNLYPYAEAVSAADVIATTGESTAWDLLPGRYAFQMSSNSLGLGLGYRVVLTRADLGVTESDPGAGSTNDDAIVVDASAELTALEG